MTDKDKAANAELLILSLANVLQQNDIDLNETVVVVQDLKTNVYLEYTLSELIKESVTWLESLQTEGNQNDTIKPESAVRS